MEERAKRVLRSTDKNVLVGLTEQQRVKENRGKKSDDKRIKSKVERNGKENDIGDTTSSVDNTKEGHEVGRSLASTKAKSSYWKHIAEERRIALETVLKENESLHEQLLVLEAENALLKEQNEETEKLLLAIQNIQQNSTETE